MVGMTRKWKAHEDMSAWSEKRERWQEKESFIPFYFLVREFFNLYPRTRLSRSPEQDNMNKSSESLEQDLNGTARLLVRLSYDLACEQAFRGALAAEREKERELATTSLEQEGILYTHAWMWAVEGPQRHLLWIVYVQYQHLQAVFWSWMTCIGCYVPQTCSLRYRGISTMKVSLL